MVTDFSKRMATLTLPICDNSGARLAHVHKILRSSLLDAFGGYTQSLVTGAWRDEAGNVYQDDSLKYEIAMDTGVKNGQLLVHLAGMACLAAKQECVMVQLASGVVHFVKQNGELS